MKTVGMKKLCKLYGVSKEKVREAIKSNTFNCVEQKGEIKIDLDSFKQSDYHIKFTYSKLRIVFGDNSEYKDRIREIHSYMNSNDIDDNLFESYYQLHKDIQSEYVYNIISKLEKESFTKSDYEDYLKSLKMEYKDNLNYEGGFVDTASINILNLMIPFFSDEFIEMYPSYYDKSFLVGIVSDIKNNIHLNYKEFEIINIYTHFLHFNTNKGLIPILDKIDFNVYETMLTEMKAENRFYNRIYSDSDERFFSNARDMFIF